MRPPRTARTRADRRFEDQAPEEQQTNADLGSTPETEETQTDADTAGTDADNLGNPDNVDPTEEDADGLRMGSEWRIAL
jgi:hypothetical protein